MASVFNLYIDENTDSTTVFELDNDDGTPVDTSELRAFCNVRKSYGQEVVFAPKCEIAPGAVNLVIKPIDTLGLAGKYVYDIEVLDSQNTITRIVEGLIIVSESATQHVPGKMIVTIAGEQGPPGPPGPPGSASNLDDVYEELDKKADIESIVTVLTQTEYNNAINAPIKPLIVVWASGFKLWIKGAELNLASASQDEIINSIAASTMISAATMINGAV